MTTSSTEFLPSKFYPGEKSSTHFAWRAIRDGIILNSIILIVRHKISILLISRKNLCLWFYRHLKWKQKHVDSLRHFIFTTTHPDQSDSWLLTCIGMPMLLRITFLRHTLIARGYHYNLRVVFLAAFFSCISFFRDNFML